MARSVISVLPAVLVWVTVIYTTPRYLRARRDVYVSAYWRAQVFLALALTVIIPTVYRWIDGHLGTPNAARWIGNACILLAGYFIDGFFVAMTRGTPAAWRGHRWALVYLALTLGAMAWLLWRADLKTETVTLELRQVNTALILYRIVYLAFFSLVTVRLIVACSHYGHASPDPTIKLGMMAMVVGGYFGVGYILASLAQVLVPASSALAQPLQLVINLSILLAVIGIMIGTNAPTLGKQSSIAALARHLDHLRAYWHLRELWQVLTDRAPEVVLPTSVTWRSALFKPADMELLLHRRVIEILDAWRVLATDTASGKAFVRSDTRQDREKDHGIGREQAPLTRAAVDEHDEYLGLQASADADHLIRIVSAVRAGSASEGQGGSMMQHRPATYTEQMRYLELVADALARRIHDAAMITLLTRFVGRMRRKENHR